MTHRAKFPILFMLLVAFFALNACSSDTADKPANSGEQTTTPDVKANETNADGKSAGKDKPKISPERLEELKKQNEALKNESRADQLNRRAKALATAYCKCADLTVDGRKTCEDRVKQSYELMSKNLKGGEVAAFKDEYSRSKAACAAK